MFKLMIALTAFLITNMTYAIKLYITNNTSDLLFKNDLYLYSEGTKLEFPSKIPAMSTGIGTIYLPPNASISQVFYFGKNNGNKSVLIQIVKKNDLTSVIQAQSTFYRVSPSDTWFTALTSSANIVIKNK